MRLAVQVNPKDFIQITKLPEGYVKDYARFLAIKMVKRLKVVVKRKLYNWSPLSKTWKLYKKQMGLSPKTWYASGELLGSIRFWYSQKDNSYYVGVNPRKLHKEYKFGGTYKTKRTKTKIIDIIRRLEYGSLNTPARPLFTEVIKEFKYSQLYWINEYLKTL